MHIINLEKNERDHFDKMADKYDSNYGYNDSFTKYKINKKAEVLTNFLSLPENKKYTKILEIGCGTGAYTRIVFRKLINKKILAVDISPKIVNVARKNTKKVAKIKFKVGSVYNLNIKNNSLDVVYGFYILHHLDIEKTVVEIHRVLKRGGIAFFYEPNILNPVVYAVKSIPFLKKLVGDSPDEWGINPIIINKQWKGFEVLNVGVTEFIPPFKFLGAGKLKYMDKLLLFLSNTPLIKYFGGSVYFFIKKL